MNRWIEIDIDFSKKSLLKNFTSQREQHQRVYYNQKEREPQPIYLLNPPNKTPMIELEKRFNWVRDSYYLVSSGYHPHIDDRRQCIISFELQNKHNVPLKFYEPDEEVYHNKPIMWNTTVLHGSEPSPAERIFFQIELEDDKPFEFYKRKYLDNELLIR